MPDQATAGKEKIRITNLGKTYFQKKKSGLLDRVLEPSTVALKNVNLSIKEFQFVGVVGPSGCGKTTMLKILAGLLPPTSGEMYFDGVAVTGPRPGNAMVFQHIGLLPWRSVEGNVLLGIELKRHRPPNKEEKERARECLRMVGLQGFEHYYPNEMSGGMQQRVGIARAMAVQPDVFLMDEPFGALDALTRLILQDELLALCDKYKNTVVFVTHDIEEAIYLSDSVVIMSSRPGVVQRIVEVPFPRPRSTGDIRSSPEFSELRHSIWEDLRREFAKGV